MDEIKIKNVVMKALEKENGVLSLRASWVARDFLRPVGRLPKLYDVDTRISYHYHQMQDDAELVGKNAKEEAYYFPDGVEPGPHPESFFGVHPYIMDMKNGSITTPGNSAGKRQP